MKKMLATLSFAALLCGSVWAAPKTLEGTFVKFEMGDYGHIDIKDDKGKEHSFFVGNHKSFNPIVEKPEKFKNKRVRVKWHHIKKDIPENGGPTEIDEAISIEVLKSK